MGVYKWQNTGEVAKGKMIYKISQVAQKRCFTVQRCFSCKLLFQTYKYYSKKTCILCRIETKPGYLESLKEMQIRQRGHFSLKKIYTDSIKLHREFQRKKDNINKALGVTVKNEPRCERIK